MVTLPCIGKMVQHRRYGSANFGGFARQHSRADYRSPSRWLRLNRSLSDALFAGLDRTDNFVKDVSSQPASSLPAAQRLMTDRVLLGG